MLLVWLVAGHAFAASPDEAVAAWDSPFSLTLPAPARSIVLRAGTDAQAWIARNQLGGAHLVSRSPAGSTVDVDLTDDAWAAVQNRLCGQPEVAACETATCAAIQLRGDVDGGPDRGPDAIQARLVRNPPERVPLPSEAAGEAGSCTGPALLPPLDTSDSAAGVQNLTLDLRGADQSSGVSTVAPDVGASSAGTTDSAPAPAEPGAEPGGTPSGAAGETGARRSFEFDVGSSFNAGGGITLGTADVPADTTDWTLEVGAGCASVSVPLDGLEPARVPELVVALVSAGTAQAIAATYGLVVVRDVTLDSTGDSLAVFATPNVAATITQLLLDARVQAAQPEFIYRTTAEAGDGPAPEAVGHTDPYAALTYGPAKSGALGLHPSVLGEGNRIAVIDTGVELEHPELAGRVESVDVSERGWSADAHGTAVAGIIAAAADNAVGSFGVAPQAEILAIKACQPKEPGGLAARCWTSTLVKALDVAITKDAAIINMSLSGPPDNLLERYVGLALEQGRLVVAGAGNGGPFARPAFPAAIPGVLAVTAVDVNDTPYAMANVGSYVDLAAPGVDIVSPAPDGGYPPLSGTSMAAAHVSGVAALLKQLAPALDGPTLSATLTSNGRDLGEPGPDVQFGAGFVDACRAAAAATEAHVTCAGSNEFGGRADANAASL
jgi:hypothetical protein